MTGNYDQFDSKWNFATFTGKPKFLVLATTPRSGSHMLGHLLRETGQFGYPLEYFHPKNFRQWNKLAGTNDVQKTLEHLIAHRTTPNGVFAVKLHYAHVLSLGGIDFLRNHLPNANYIQLIRKDAVAQAVSRAIAKMSSKWIALDSDSQIQAIQRPLQFDWQLVDQCLKDNLTNEAAWRYALSVLNPTRVELTLEHLIADQPSALKQIGELLSIDLDEKTIDQAAPTARQHTALNKEWKRLYLQEKPQQGMDVKTKVTPSAGYRLKKFLASAAGQLKR